MTVEARSGAGGAVAWTYVSRKTGDGHYIAISGPTLLSNSLLGVGDLNYKDITPIAQLFTEYTVFAVRADGPIKTGADLVNAMRTSSTLSIGVAPGFGGSNHVAMLKLARAANIDPSKLAIAPYRGANESVQALLGGHIDVAPATISGARSHFSNPASSAPSPSLRRIGSPARRRISRHGKSRASTWSKAIGAASSARKISSAAELAYWNTRVAELVKTDDWAQVLKQYHWDADYADSRRLQALSRRPV